MSNLKAKARRVQDAITQRGFEFQVRAFPDSTRTAEEAAAAVGCVVGQIAKSLVFRGRDSGKAVLVIASGANRVDEKAVAALIGEKIARADADFVRAQTGFAIGGVPPLGHETALTTLIDEDLLAHPEIWAAAGTPNAVFALPASALAELTGGQVARVRKEIPAV